MSSQAVAMFATANARFKDREANTTGRGRGWVPPEGEYLCVVKEMKIDTEAGWRWNKAGKGQKPDFEKRDGADIEFRYVIGQHDEFQGKEFRGSRFNILLGSDEGLPDNQMQRLEIAESRLKGHLMNILGLKEDNMVSLTEALGQVSDKLTEAAASGTIIKVKLRQTWTSYTDKNGKEQHVPDDEFILEHL